VRTNCTAIYRGWPYHVNWLEWAQARCRCGGRVRPTTPSADGHCPVLVRWQGRALIGKWDDVADHVARRLFVCLSVCWFACSFVCLLVCSREDRRTALLSGTSPCPTACRRCNLPATHEEGARHSYHRDWGSPLRHSCTGTALTPCHSYHRDCAHPSATATTGTALTPATAARCLVLREWCGRSGDSCASSGADVALVSPVPV
jgi:hypothetical protein